MLLAQGGGYLSVGATELPHGERLIECIMGNSFRLQLQVGKNSAVVVRLGFKNSLAVNAPRQHFQSHPAADIAADQQDSIVVLFYGYNDIAMTASALTELSPAILDAAVSGSAAAA